MNVFPIRAGESAAQPDTAARTVVGRGDGPDSRVPPYPSPALQAALDRIDREFDTPRLIVNSVARGEGVYFWEIKSRYRPAVEAEIMRLQQADGVEQSDFYQPWREPRDGLMWWRATGFTRSAATPAWRPGDRVTRAVVAAG